MPQSPLRAGLRSVFIKRRQSGFIRECHGDAHLANMVMIQGRPVLFDCIEFNEYLRWIDVMSEVAFTVMDLDDRKATAFSNRFLNQYLEATEDYAGLVVLNYFKVYRALVRAKVASIRRGQECLDPAADKRDRAELQGYLDLAAGYLQPARPCLIITHGLSGSGKTYGSGQLLQKIGAVRVRTDVERKRMREGYSPEANRRVYQRVADLVRAGLQAGKTMIADGTFLRKADRQLFCDLAKDLKLPFFILSFQAPESLLKERILRRAKGGRDVSEATKSVLALQKKSLQPLEAFEKQYILKIGPSSRERLGRLINNK